MAKEKNLLRFCSVHLIEMLDTVMEVAMSAVLIAACGVIVVDLLKDIVITVKKTLDEVKGTK